MTTPTPIVAIDLNKRIEQFVALRDKTRAIEETHKAQLEPFKTALETVGNILLDHLQKTGSESVGTEAGTAYISSRQSASLQDPEAFFSYVIANKEYELLDRKANVSAVEEFIKKNGGLPPGVKYSKMLKIGVRRAGAKNDV